MKCQAIQHPQKLEDKARDCQLEEQRKGEEGEGGHVLQRRRRERYQSRGAVRNSKVVTKSCGIASNTAKIKQSRWDI